MTTFLHLCLAVAAAPLVTVVLYFAGLLFLFVVFAAAHAVVSAAAHLTSPFRKDRE
jgi:hypothetical protein